MTITPDEIRKGRAMTTAQQRDIAQHQMVEYGRRMRKRAEMAEEELNRLEQAARNSLYELGKLFATRGRISETDVRRAAQSLISVLESNRDQTC